MVYFSQKFVISISMNHVAMGTKKIMNSKILYSISMSHRTKNQMILRSRFEKRDP